MPFCGHRGDLRRLRTWVVRSGCALKTARAAHLPLLDIPRVASYIKILQKVSLAQQSSSVIHITIVMCEWKERQCNKLSFTLKSGIAFARSY